MDGFALDELNVQLGSGDGYVLITRAFDVHLDPGLDGIPKDALPRSDSALSSRLSRCRISRLSRCRISG